MELQEIRLRCIEAAARSPIVHKDGPAVGVREVASIWFNWIISGETAPGKAGTLHVPKPK